MGSSTDHSGRAGRDDEDELVADKISHFFAGFMALHSEAGATAEPASKDSEGAGTAAFDLSFLDNTYATGNKNSAGPGAGQDSYPSMYQIKKTKLEWVPVGEHRTIQGHHITCGGYYISKEGTEFGAAPFAVSESLPVALANEPTTPLDNVQVNYDRMPSTYRRDFLVWLSTEPAERPMIGTGIGLFALLILKGIGHWLTHEGANSFYDQDQSQRQGLAMLLQTNAPGMPVQNSLRNEIVCWLELSRHMSLDEFMEKESTWKYESWWSNLQLAMLGSHGKPLQAEQASHIAASLSERHYQEHIQYGTQREFKHWFTSSYPNGLDIPCTDKPLTLSLTNQMLDRDDGVIRKASVTFDNLLQPDRKQLDELLRKCYAESVLHMERAVGVRVSYGRKVTDLQCLLFLPKNFWSNALTLWLDELIGDATRNPLVLTYASIAGDLFSNDEAANMPKHINGELLADFLRRKLNAELNQSGIEAISIGHPFEEESIKAVRNDALCVLPMLQIEALNAHEQNLIESTQALLDIAYLPELRVHKADERREKHLQIARWINRQEMRREVAIRLQGMASLYGVRPLYRTWKAQHIKVPDSWSEEGGNKVYECLNSLHEDFRALHPKSKVLSHWSNLLALWFPKQEGRTAPSERLAHKPQASNAQPNAQPMATTSTHKAASASSPAASGLWREAAPAQPVSFALDLKRVQQLQESTQEVDDILSRLFAEPSTDTDPTENK